MTEEELEQQNQMTAQQNQMTAQQNQMTAQQNQMTAQEYINQINNLRENTVSRVEYERIRNDNRELAKALINGTGANIPGITKPEEKPDLDDLRKKLFTKKSKNDLEYFTNLLALRDGVMADGQPDPFLPINREFRATAQDEADAERIATQIKEAIEYADGDPAVFSNDLRRRCGMSRR